ncbi:tRNA-splicing endonuclease subunit [Mortierella sp. GBA30]|nr:tRNA-splicing endonuclease subunit [Mortierella sp. GBA30]
MADATESSQEKERLQHEEVSSKNVTHTDSESIVEQHAHVKLLRQAHRIVGSLTGSLPRSPMQNIFQGLPLRLLPEEVYVLCSNGLVDIVDENRSYLQPAAKDMLSSAASGATSTVSLTTRPKDTPATKTRKAIGGSESVVLHTLSDHLPWYSPQITAPVSEAGTVVVPSEVQDSTMKLQRNIVFKHLWASLKCYLAPGMKFGGDYLLYRNDPLVCHASLIVSVKEMSAPLSLTDLASCARLASTVQKQHLICSVTLPQEPSPTDANPGQDKSSQGHSADFEEQEHRDECSIIMFAIEWAGF